MPVKNFNNKNDLLRIVTFGLFKFFVAMRTEGCSTFHVISAKWANFVDFAYFGLKVFFFFFGMLNHFSFKSQVNIVRKSEDDNCEDDVIQFQSKKQPTEEYAPKQTTETVYLFEIIHYAPTFLGVEIDGG